MKERHPTVLQVQPPRDSSLAKRTWRKCWMNTTPNAVGILSQRLALLNSA